MVKIKINSFIFQLNIVSTLWPYASPIQIFPSQGGVALFQWRLSLCLIEASPSQFLAEQGFLVMTSADVFSFLQKKKRILISIPIKGK